MVKEDTSTIILFKIIYNYYIKVIYCKFTLYSLPFFSIPRNKNNNYWFLHSPSNLLTDGRLSNPPHMSSPLNMLLVRGISHFK